MVDDVWSMYVSADLIVKVMVVCQRLCKLLRHVFFRVPVYMTATERCWKLCVIIVLLPACNDSLQTWIGWLAAA